jgi:GNAT superfamily N-acetyltransferase
MAQVRRADENDIAEIVSVVNAAFEVERDFRGGDRTSIAEISRLMENNTFLVAILDGQLAGAVLVRANGPIGYFGMLAVQPGLQRSEIGRALLEAAEDYCRVRGCTEMTLSTGSVRHELLDRYARHGYKVTSIEAAPKDGPFTKPIEIVKMAKPL